MIIPLKLIKYMSIILGEKSSSSYLYACRDVLITGTKMVDFTNESNSGSNKRSVVYSNKHFRAFFVPVYGNCF